ncbi:MAG: hypothetical protein EBS01_09140 [Verrucomicrobia bacterium]|nr:hypothetical protein [Verrucomicrobiota bacterium]
MSPCLVTVVWQVCNKIVSNHLFEAKNDLALNFIGFLGLLALLPSIKTRKPRQFQNTKPCNTIHRPSSTHGNLPTPAGPPQLITH